MVDSLLLSYVQHGLDQAYAHTQYALTRLSPHNTYLQQAEAYIKVALTHGDARVQSWPLMDYRVMLCITVGYLWLIAALYLLMNYVQPMSRWPQGSGFNTKPLQLIHNANLTAISAYMFVTILYEAVRNHYSLFGNAVDPSRNGLPMASVLWLFYVSKILEFGDTIFMALRKNNRQITFLHLYHHASIYMIWWVVVYYAPGGESYFSAMLNSFIHVLLYGYYLWSSIAPKQAAGVKPRPTQPAYYRQYITNMQLFQFVLMLIQATYDLLVPSKYPQFAAKILFYYMFTMLALFGNFYVQQYLKPKQRHNKKIE